MFQHIDMVVGGFSLAAFAIAAILALTKHAINREKQLIESANDDHKARLVEHALNKYHVSSDSLTRQQKYDLIIAGMESKSRFWNKLFLFVCAITVITAISTVLIVLNNKTDDPVTIDFVNQPEFVEAQQAYLYENDNDKAYQKYLEAASKDNPLAMAALAKLSFRGWGTDQSIKAATFWAEKTFEELEADAFKNNGWARYSLAYLYKYGIGTEIDEKRAIELYTEASNYGVGIASNNLGLIFQDDPDIQDLKRAEALFLLAYKQTDGKLDSNLTNLGNFYYFESNKHRDLQKAERYYKELAAIGSSYGMFRVGFINLHEKETPDYGTAFEYLTKALNQDYELAYSQLALLHLRDDFKQRDPSKAIEYLQTSRENGNMFASYRLARLYRMEQAELDTRAIPLESSFEEAIKLYEEAAEQGQHWAVFDLGYAYRRGHLGLPLDLKKAQEYFHKAWELGNESAPYYIGHYHEFYANSLGYQEAIKWYKIAIEEGDDEVNLDLLRVYNKDKSIVDKLATMQEFVAQSPLAESTEKPKRALYKRMQAFIHANNGSDPEEHEKAEAYLLEAIELGDREAHYELALLYNHEDWNPEGVNEKAFAHFKKASDFSSCAENYLGIYYEQAKVSAKGDYENALNYFKRAADKGNEYGMYNYGRLLAKGLGQNEDISLATTYLTKAHERGATGASFLLFQIYNDQSNPDYNKEKAKAYLLDAAQKSHPKEKIDDAFMSLYAEREPQYAALSCSSG